MSGEIERTLEISNQSIINAAVDMSDIQGTVTLSSKSVVNMNLPPRPERVNIKAPAETAPSSKVEPIRQVYSPISRPSSAEGMVFPVSRLSLMLRVFYTSTVIIYNIFFVVCFL